MNKLATVLLTSALVLPMTASAKEGFYIGAGVGSAHFGGFFYDDDKDINDKKLFDMQGDDAAFKLYSGYYFNRIVGVELGVSKYGKISSKSDSANQGELSPTALSLAANLGYTFDNGWRPFAIAGFSALDLAQSEPWFEDDSGVAMRLGTGGEYSPPSMPALSFRLAYEFDVFTAKVNKNYSQTKEKANYHTAVGAWYAGVSYRF